MATKTRSNGTIAMLDPLIKDFILWFLSASALKISLNAKNAINAITAIIL